MAIHIADELPEEPIPAASRPSRAAPHFDVSWRAMWYALGICIALIVVVVLLLLHTTLPI